MSLPRWIVPTTWSWVRAGDIADIVGGGTPPSKVEDNFAEEGIPWIGPADLTGFGGVYIGRGRRDLSERGYAASGATLMPAGAVLFSSRAPIGYCVIAANPVSTNQGFKSWVCSEGIVSEYVRYYLLSSVDYADSLASGTTFREISGKRVAEMAFPLPPLAEQRRIVAKLDALTVRFARARAEMSKTSDIQRRLREAICGDAISVEAAELPLGNALTDIRYGTAQKCGYDGSTPVLRIPNVARGEIDLSDLKSADFEPKEVAALSLAVGDVLIVRSNGSLDLVGRSAVVSEDAAGMLYAGYLIRLRLDPKKAMPAYVQLWFSAPSTRAVIEGLARSSSGVNNINSKQLQALRIRLPDLKTQKKIAEAAAAAFARADRLEAEAQKALALIDRLEAAILARAFRGELVPQDPNDEPASVLLERIRARRAAEPKAKRGRRPKLAS